MDGCWDHHQLTTKMNQMPQRRIKDEIGRGLNLSWDLATLLLHVLQAIIPIFGGVDLKCHLEKLNQPFYQKAEKPTLECSTGDLRDYTPSLSKPGSELAQKKKKCWIKVNPSLPNLSPIDSLGCFHYYIKIQRDWKHQSPKKPTIQFSELALSKMAASSLRQQLSTWNVTRANPGVLQAQNREWLSNLVEKKGQNISLIF